MQPTEISCPSCGAGYTIYNPGLITIVCEYCQNAVYWDKEGLKNAGKQSILPAGFSRLYRGATGSLKDKRFVVLGRVRYSFGQGFWDEWFLEFSNGTTGWISEDNHELSLEMEVPDVAVPGFAVMRPGTKINVRDTDIIIEEVGQAECLGMEGDLSIEVQTGEKYNFADGSSPDGRYTLGIEYDDDPPTVFLGKWLKYGALSIDDEGLEW